MYATGDAVTHDPLCIYNNVIRFSDVVDFDGHLQWDL